MDSESDLIQDPDDRIVWHPEEVPDTFSTGIHLWAQMTGHRATKEIWHWGLSWTTPRGA